MATPLTVPFAIIALCLSLSHTQRETLVASRNVQLFYFFQNCKVVLILKFNYTFVSIFLKFYFCMFAHIFSLPVVRNTCAIGRLKTETSIQSKKNRSKRAIRPQNKVNLANDFFFIILLENANLQSLWPHSFTCGSNAL